MTPFLIPNFGIYPEFQSIKWLGQQAKLTNFGHLDYWVTETHFPLSGHGIMASKLSLCGIC